MKCGQLYAQALPDAVTLYWCKPKNAPIQAEYSIFLDGQQVGSAYRTHFTLEQLEPDRFYQLEVKLNGQSLGTIRTRTRPAFHRLDVRSFGASGDGKTMDTAALQKAIDACEPEDEVYLPAGIYCTGALRLHSDMILHLDEGAVLQGTDRPEDYLPRIHSRFEGIEQECYSSLLNLGELDHASGPNCRNVLIYGKGTISSGGQVLAQRIIDLERERLRDYLSENAGLVASCENDHTIPGRVRPRLINLSNCENVRITGLTLKNGASWNVHMIYSRDIVTDHCTFISEGVWNGDGWDPDSSERCVLFGCRFRTGDDCVAIKSGKNPEGNLIARPSKAIRVFDCSCGLGRGVCVGSEISGGVEDVKIWDCDLVCSLFGLQIKGTKKRGGYLSTILDACTKQVLSYTLSESLEVDFVLETVEKLIDNHGISLNKNTILHSDQGCHYTCVKFIQLLKNSALRQSMSRRGNCWDNAPQESFFGHMKDELSCEIPGWNSFADVERSIGDWIDYYNSDRYQWDLAKLSPNEYYDYLTSGIYPTFP